MEAYDQGVDIFGLGAVIFLILEGRPTFERSGDPAERCRALVVGRALRAPESLRFRREMKNEHEIPVSGRSRCAEEVTIIGGGPMQRSFHEDRG